MPGPEFFQTPMGRHFYEHTMPDIAVALLRIAGRMDTDRANLVSAQKMLSEPAASGAAVNPRPAPTRERVEQVIEETLIADGESLLDDHGVDEAVARAIAKGIGAALFGGEE